jgi:predicted DNA binding protein
MPHAELTVTLPERVWIGAVSRAAPKATVRVLSAVPRPADGVALAAVEAPDPEAVLDRMAAAEGVTAVEPLDRDEMPVVRFETTEPLLLAAVQAAGIPLSFPVEVRDGRAHLAVTAPRDRIAALGEALDDLGLAYSLDRLYASVDDATPLTDRQREALLAALEHGYYDTPRETTLSALAGELGVAKSTLSERLHRAEEAVVRTFVDSRLETELGTDRDGPS